MKFKSITKKLLAIACLTPLFAMANEGGPALDKFEVNTRDNVSLQRGAQTFVNYCLSCHSAQAMRFNGLNEIGIPDQQIKDNMLFAGEKVTDQMKVAMNPKDGKGFFGATPPDLSVIARARGADWLYTYLRSFYRDSSRPTGWNNVVFDKVGMPHVLWELQGEQHAVFKAEKNAEGQTVQVLEKLELVKPGLLTSIGKDGKANTADYDQKVGDLVNYLVWMGEPHRNLREQMGYAILFFLGVLLLPFVYFLKRDYWKEVH
ncbi:cytochrome c1 [Leeia sp. TBRC 13508]|uniref:Cytochrome c1 n=1 Tax=Leeia speluncae TaxID=2884804 RepID=A0ABS8D4P5_9NEIS|nr:cytochrome c1 [Leeia speluncae]MCB6183189.1 cytochrome c1 [Leeia speluncae]